MHILLSSTCSASWPHGHTFSGGDLCVWNQNWKFGFNDKRPMSNLLLLFFFFFCICYLPFPGLRALSHSCSINKMDPVPALIRSHNKAIHARRA